LVRRYFDLQNNKFFRKGRKYFWRTKIQRL
jgi:hypothetical protein